MNVIIGDTDAVAETEPDHGRPVAFAVQLRKVKVSASRYDNRVADRYIVCLKGSTGEGFSRHISFERAVAACVSRARRYERAYSVPRGVAA